MPYDLEIREKARPHIYHSSSTNRAAICPTIGTRNLEPVSLRPKIQLAIQLAECLREWVGCNVPIECVCILVRLQREEPDQSYITESQEPREERGPGEEQMQDEQRSEEQAGLPSVESAGELAGSGEKHCNTGGLHEGLLEATQPSTAARLLVDTGRTLSLCIRKTRGKQSPASPWTVAYLT